MGAAGPASARLNAAWTTQSRSRGGDPKLALVALPLRGRTRQKRLRSGLDYLSRNKWLAFEILTVTTDLEDDVGF